jgi:hypothetical protein
MRRLFKATYPAVEVTYFMIRQEDDYGSKQLRFWNETFLGYFKMRIIILRQSTAEAEEIQKALEAGKPAEIRIILPYEYKPRLYSCKKKKLPGANLGNKLGN